VHRYSIQSQALADFIAD
jgi:ribonuclease HI